MSDLPKCLLCGCAPTSYPMPDGTHKHHCANRECTLHAVLMTPDQWNALMGRGEPVAWRYWNEKSKSWNETHSKLVAEAMGEGGRKVEPLYTQEPAVDGAVRLLDAAIALRDDLLLRAEMADDGCRVVFAGASVWDEFKKAIDAAMTKEQGNAKSDR